MNGPLRLLQDQFVGSTHEDWDSVAGILNAGHLQRGINTTHSYKTPQNHTQFDGLKVSFHYPSSRPENSGCIFLTPVNSGSGNRPLVTQLTGALDKPDCVACLQCSPGYCHYVQRIVNTSAVTNNNHCTLGITHIGQSVAFLHSVTRPFDLILTGEQRLIIDYPCAKFSDCIFSNYGFITLTDRQTHRQNHRRC